MGLFSFFCKEKNNKAENKDTGLTPKVEIRFSKQTTKEHESQISAEAEEIAIIDENCRRSEHGLTVSQILLLDYCKKGKYPNPEGGYQRFWWFDYGVKNVETVLCQLEKGGFIRYALPLDILPTLKVDELKNILSNLQLPVAGKKADLVECIRQNTDDNTLRQFIHSNKYTLTELGERELADNIYVSYLHSHKYPEVSVWDVNKNADLEHWRDYIWNRFNTYSIEYVTKGQWGLYRNIRFYMAEFLYDEARYTDAFEMYGEVCFYDVNGMETFGDYDDPSDLLLKGIITQMKKVAEEAGLTENCMREILKKRIETCHPVTQRVPKGQMTDIIVNKINKGVK